MTRSIAIIGGGPCGLMLAAELDPGKFTVSLYEQNAAPGRKFLVAGDGGLNLTHSEPSENFIQRYTPCDFLRPAFSHFNNLDLRRWFHDLGIETYTGTSGRVFPARGIKPVAVLNAIVQKLAARGVAIKTRHRWNGFSSQQDLLFETAGHESATTPDLVVYCTGGGSWPVTGSTGRWSTYLREKNIGVLPFRASNCAFIITWPEQLVKKVEGRALKNVTITCGGKTHAGEIVLTASGVEGSGIYPLSPQIREELARHGKAQIFIDFKPAVSRERILQKLNVPRDGKAFSGVLRDELHLGETQLRLIKSFTGREQFLDPASLTSFIKQFPLFITGAAPVEDAISTVGGVALNEIDEHFMLNKLPGHYAIGEMLDYDAPTGGYLLQSCFSMGNFLAAHLNKM